MSSPQPTTFFSLARELRDLIYFQLLHSVDHRPLAHNIHVSATDVPIAHLLRISRKFKQEYQFASDQLSTVTIFNYEESSFSFSPFERDGEAARPTEAIIQQQQQTLATLLPSSLTSIPHITFSLLAPPSTTKCTAGLALSTLESYTDALLAQFELKRIKSVSIHVEISASLPRDRGAAFSVLDFEGALLWSGNWTSLIRLKRLTVWRGGGDYNDGGGDSGRGKGSLMLEWERERCRFGTRMKRTEVSGNWWLDGMQL